MIVTHPTPSQLVPVPSLQAWLGDGETYRVCASDDFRSRADAHQLVIRAGPRYEAEQVLALVGERDWREELDVTTDHALLVLLGQYARHLGLIEQLEAVPLDQRTRDHTPQTKLIQFWVGVLAGLEHLQDFNDAPQPLVKDQAVIASWGQPAFAHYSGVSRTLDAADDQTLQAVLDVLQRVSQPFLDAEVMALLRRGGPLVVDVDLTGRRVSPTSTTYPDADFGWMDDEVANGYQAAITSLSGGPCERLLLSSQRYSGRAQSAACLQAAVRQMESTLGLHPRRRTELVQAQLHALGVNIEAVQTALDSARAQRRALFDQLQTARNDERLAQAEATRLTAAFEARGRPERPHSYLAKARQRLESAQKRQQRAGRGLRANAARLTKLEQEGLALQAQQTRLLDWLATLENENATQPNPPPMVLRIDAGFSTDDNLTWLIEMGYVVYTKAHNGQTTARLHRQVAPTTAWTRVGRNAEAVALPQQHIAECPYRLQALLVRYHLPAGLSYTTLLYYGDRPPPTDLKAWFGDYNARQTIEAGIKEGKSVFPMRRPWVRSPLGLQLQEHFSRFAANFVRWAASWAQQIVRDANWALRQALTEVKTLVQIVAHCRVRLVHHAVGRVMIFDEHGPFAGSMFLLAGQATYQYVLPLFKSLSFEPHRTM
ncbi:MAG: hypothetical protein XU15_C0035G0004 [candidate division NC10 bacterium CSP1-5]|nr:MAG: hypothetical protein XU15_C0035G0004 [candidate division NC10 bacterium CSP1-5]